MSGKLVIFSSPSGAGKTTIVKHLLASGNDLRFSVSATSRPKRKGEVEGKDYYFLTTGAFREKAAAGEFLEWEEVYGGLYYGTLKSEVDRLLAEQKHVIFDVDVLGALNIKKHYGSRALSVFVRPPSLEALEARLKGRGTETPETLKERLSRAREEITYAEKFDRVIVNDNLDKALRQAKNIVGDFLESA